MSKVFKSKPSITMKNWCSPRAGSSNCVSRLPKMLGLAIIWLMPLFVQVPAQRLALDPSFNGNGKLIEPIGKNAADFPRDMAVQPDGKIVTISSIWHDGGVNRFHLFRYHPDGSLDLSFGSNGHQIVGIGSQNADPVAVAIQADGKIVIAATLASSAGTPVVVRLTAVGGVDNSFGTAGITFGTIGSARSLALQPDGKIVVGGYYQNTAQGRGNDFFIHRFNIDGSDDTSFDVDGRVVTPIGPAAASDALSDLLIQSDGKIVATGTVDTNKTGIVRYLPNGTLDTSFDGDGIVIAQPAATYLGENPSAISIQPDGKLVVAGAALLSGNSHALVRRYNSDGSPDTGFGTDGYKTTATISVAYSVGVQPDGRIIIGGGAGAPNLDFALMRFLSDGSPDNSVGVNGVVLIQMGSDNDEIRAHVHISGSRIIAMGSVRNGTVWDLGLAKLGPVAKYDFDADGKTDIGIFRPSVGEWWINRSSTGVTFAAQFGSSTDVIMPGDFSGDGKADMTFWRPSTGEWFVVRSEDFSYFSFPFGSSGDLPTVGDFDGDGHPDAAVFRPSVATWFIRRSSDGGATIQQFGAAGDVPVAADYDGDGKTDIAIYRPSLGQWWLSRSTAGVIAMTFGGENDKPVQGDYTGDGKDDVAIWRPGTGEWFVLRSEDFSYFSFPFGLSTDIPAPGDYDGDGKYDATLFRPSVTTWFSQRTSAGILIQQFGATGDRPIANAFVP